MEVQTVGCGYDSYHAAKNFNIKIVDDLNFRGYSSSYRNFPLPAQTIIKFIYSNIFENKPMFFKERFEHYAVVMPTVNQCDNEGMKKLLMAKPNIIISELESGIPGHEPYVMILIPKDFL